MPPAQAHDAQRTGWAGTLRPGPPCRRAVSTNQAVSTYDVRRYLCTASSGTRKDRPTRMAGSSPACTMRYTVIFDTRMIEATSATVRNRTSASCRSLDMTYLDLLHARIAGFPSGGPLRSCKGNCRGTCDSWGSQSEKLAPFVQSTRRYDLRNCTQSVEPGVQTVEWE